MRLQSNNIILAPLEKQDIDYIHSITSDYSNLSETFPSYVRPKVYWEKKFEKTGL